MKKNLRRNFDKNRPLSSPTLSSCLSPCHRKSLFIVLLYLLSLMPMTSAESSAASGGPENATAHECHEDHSGIKLASFRWNSVGVYVTITAFVLVAGLAKLGFHQLHWLSSVVPESCLLILLGLCLSAIFYFTTDQDAPIDPCSVRFKFPRFTSMLFFFVLLPPVILDSAYSLHDRVFFDNLGSVLLFAVIGTLINVFTIGPSLWGLCEGGLIPNMAMTLKDALVFSSLISAVDPVAVLAIFQELGVNQNLYFLVFGESLLNDGVTVVLYNTMNTFNHMEVISVGQYFLAILSFLIVCFGAISIGIIYGILTALFTKWTSSVRVVEPLAILALAYLSYLTAELFHFSGIISLIVCGLVQAHYSFYNISQKSYICVKYFTKMASATCDTIIFMFLGMVLVNENHKWNTAFVLWTNALCLIYRFISVFLLSALANVYRTKSITFEEQFISAYGGLRGAVAFSLAITMDEKMKERNIYIFTTLIVILFTVFVQGITIKPLVQLLKIKRKNQDQKSLIVEISETSMDHMMAGIEEILGHHGDFYLRGLLMHYNEKYLKKWFLHESSDTKLTRLFEKIALSEHYAHLYGPIAMVEDHMKPLIDFKAKEKVMQAPMTPHQEEMLFRASMRRQNSHIARRDPVFEDDENEDYTEYPQRRRNRMSARSSFFPPSARRQISVVSVQPPENEQQRDATALRRAFKENRYNKLHYKYNKNLVNEDDQEINDHLSRRSINARRMSTIASANYRRKSNANEAALPGQVNSMDKDDQVMYEGLRGSLILREMHRQRSFSQRQRVFRSLRDSSTTDGGTSPAVSETKSDCFYLFNPDRKESFKRKEEEEEEEDEEEDEEEEEEDPLMEVKT
ncbi:UNVERIFIED_CONTAM: hypothetical protein RMT77_017722 [Armadillidium vulgare]